MPHKNKIRSSKVKCAFLILLLLILYTIWCIRPIRPRRTLFSGNILNVTVHLDFKGSPVKLSYLQRLFPKLKRLGVTGILLEYEDMFPYEGNLVNISAKNCYKRSELKIFIELAIKTGFEIIPLIQTFGHMEHVLKLSDFEHLREVKFYPDSICPSVVDSLQVIQDMLQQVTKFHTAIHPLKYIHIGCDEVFHINQCKRCQRRHLKRHDIYLNHVKAITKIIDNLTPHAIVLIWDDMLRDIPIQDWQLKEKKEIGNEKLHNIQPVYWDYSSSLAVSHINMMKYHRKFQKIWIASAFRGADGRTSSYPDLLKRLYNHYEWMMFIRDYKFGGEEEAFRFEGIILTGWSRYSHMDPPCDLIQVSIPSLFLNLLFIKWSMYNEEKLVVDGLDKIFNEHIHKDLMEVLKCSDSINMEYFDGKQCDYDGSYLYEVLTKCNEFVNEITDYVKDNGLLAVKYYAKFSYVNRHQVLDNAKWCNRTIGELITIETDIRKVMSEYYDEYFIEEYVNFKLYDTKAMLLSLLEDLTNILYVTSWDRKPFILY